MDGRKTASLLVSAVIGGLLVSAAAAPLRGQSSREPIIVNAYQRFVPYTDLALNTVEGQAVLVERVGMAVNAVCPDVDEYGNSYDVLRCKDFAWEGARPQISRAFRNARSGRSVAMMIEVSSAGAR
jgi:UrcA family protein